MDDQQLLQLLHDKQPLLWTRAEGQTLWERLQESDVLKQSLRSNGALRERAATVLAPSNHDLDSLLAVPIAAQPRESSHKWLIAACVLLLVAVGGAMLYIANAKQEKPPVTVTEPEDSETESPQAPEQVEPSPEEEIETHDPPAESSPSEEPSAEPPVSAEPAAEPVETPEVLPERTFVNGPWDAVMAQEELPTFAEICFDDFDPQRKSFGKQDFEPWVTAVPGESGQIDQANRNNRTVATTKGILRLQAPWTEDTWLRLKLTDTKQFFIHLFNGNQGITLAHYVESWRMWHGYATTREPGKSQPATWALTAGDDYRNSRTVAHDDGTILIGWRAGEILICRGDVILLRAPLAHPPHEAFVEGNAQFEGIELVRSSDAPIPLHRRSTQPLPPPAKFTWDTERLTKNATFEKLPNGSVKLACEEQGEPTWVMAPLEQTGLRSVIFEISNFTAGAGVLLRHEEKGFLYTFRITNNTPENQLTLRDTGDHHTWQQDLGHVKEKKLAAVGDRVWIKLLQGSRMIRAWVSVDGIHWAETMFPGAQHHIPITGIGLQLAGNVPQQHITLRSVVVEPLEAIHSLVEEELLNRAPVFTEVKDLGSWLVEVTAAQPPEVEAAAWRRACALKTLGAGCEKAVANDLLDSLLDYTLASDLPLERQCDIIDDAVLLMYGWEDGNRLLETVVGHYFEAGQQAYRKGETEHPYSAVRRRVMSGPYVHYGSPKLSQTESVEWELLHLATTGQWQALLQTCKELRFYDSQSHLPLMQWAEAVAQREAAVEVGSGGISALKSSWRHPLEEELSKETYNLVAELRSLLDSKAYVDAARLITMVNPTESSGVAPSPYDDQLLFSLTAAIHWAISEYPPLAEAMKANFADLAELRVRKAIGEGFAPDVMLAAAQFAPTPAAAEAHRWLGDRALSVGRFQQAIAEYREALTKANAVTRSAIEPRLRLASAMLGKEAGAAPQRPVQLGDRSVPANEFEKVVEDMRGRAKSGNANMTLEVATPPLPKVPAPSFWKAEKRGQVEGPQGNDPNSTGNRHARDLKIPWADRQIVVIPFGENMLMANRFQVSAYSRADGHRLWISENPPGNPLRSQEWPLVPMRPLMVGDRIVVRMLYDQGPQLVCLNRENGKIHWSVAGTRSRILASDPLWLRNELLVVVWDYTRDTSGQLSLCRYDLHSGELLQSQPLVTLRDSWFERRICEVAPLNDGLLVAAGGVLLKTNAAGEVQWLRRQALTPPEEHRGWARQHWQPPLVEDSVSYVLQPGVMSLDAVGTETGKLLWSVVLTDIERLLGVVGDQLLVQCERRIMALDRHSGIPVWNTTLEVPLLHGFLLDEEQLLIAAQQVSPNTNREIFPELISLEVATGRIVARTVVHELKHQDPQVGSLIVADDRLWLFFGRGSHEVGREIWELKPQKRLAPLPPPLPPADLVWTEHVDPLLEDSVMQVAPGWALWHSPYDSRENVGYREEDRGHKNLSALMLTQEAPVVLAREVTFSRRSRPKVRLVVGAEPGRNWFIRTTVGGERGEPLEITQKDHGDYWKTIEIDLTQHAGRSGWLMLEMRAANGTHFPVMLEKLELVQ